MPFADLDAARLETALLAAGRPELRAQAERLSGELRQDPPAELGIADRLEALVA